MRHVEGGWPKDVDFTEQSDVSRFRKKAEKDEEYKGSVKILGPIVARCMKQINTIDIYEVRAILLFSYLFYVFFRNILRVTILIIQVNLQMRRGLQCFEIPTK
jgi:hypothetical protein